MNGLKKACAIGLVALATFPTVSPVSATPKSSSLASTLFGTANPQFTQGKKSRVSLVVIGPVQNFPSGGAVVPVIVENRTERKINDIEVSGPAMMGSRIVGSGDSQGFEPSTVGVGEIDLGYVYFQNRIPSDSKFRLSIDYGKGVSQDQIDLKVTAANYSQGSIDGIIKNTSGQFAAGPLTVNVYCFTKVGTLLSEQNGDVGPETLNKGAITSFQAELYGSSCPTYLAESTSFNNKL